MKRAEFFDELSQNSFKSVNSFQVEMGGIAINNWVSRILIFILFLNSTILMNLNNL